MGKNYSDQLTPMRRARSAGQPQSAAASVAAALRIYDGYWIYAVQRGLQPPCCRHTVRHVRRHCIVGWFSGRPVEAKLK